MFPSHKILIFLSLLGFFLKINQGFANPFPRDIQDTIKQIEKRTLVNLLKKNISIIINQNKSTIKRFDIDDLAFSMKINNSKMELNYGGCDCQNEKCTCCAFVEIEKINLTQPSNKNKFYLMDLSFDSLLDKFIFF